MATLTVSAQLTAPPDLLWRSLLRLDRCHEWLSVHDSFPRPPRLPPAPGDAFVQCLTLLGMTGELHWTFEELLPPRRLVLSTQLMPSAGLKAAFLLAPRSPGTLVTCRYELSGGRAAGVLIRATGPEARKQTLASLTALDRLTAHDPPESLDPTG